MTFPIQTHAPDGCITLLSRLDRSVPVSAPEADFQHGVGQRDEFIISPHLLNWIGRQVIAGRVESRDVEHSEIVFFAEVDANGVWQSNSFGRNFSRPPRSLHRFHWRGNQFGWSSFSPVTMADGSIGWRDGILPGEFGGQSKDVPGGAGQDEGHPPGRIGG